MPPTRRKALFTGAALLLGGVAVAGYQALTPSAMPISAVAGTGGSPAKKAVMYKPLQCGCCDKYAAYLERHGFSVEVHSLRSLSDIRRSAGVPPGFAGCHTLVVDGYTVDGLVPLPILRRLLEEKPDIKGITLPGMPWGAPGMEERPKAGPLVVYAFDSSGARPVEYGRE